MKLSNSRLQMYKRCPRSYDLHYNKKIRSRTFGSPLFFGLALDEAINRLLIDKKKVLTEAEEELKKQTVIEVFDYHMKNGTVNGNPIKLQEYQYLQFGKADFDISLLTEADFDELGQDDSEVGAFMEWYYFENKKWKDKDISEEDTKLFNKINWFSLHRKGLMILETYEEEIMPQIHEVFEIQKEISLPDGRDNSVIGFIDFICSFVDAPDTKVIVDNKSSSKPYKQKDLDESDQLCTYSEAENLPDISYIVYEKNIRKRDPRVRINILRGKAVESHIEETFDNYSELCNNIEEEKFPEDRSERCFFFGRPCLYKSICHNDGQMGPDLVDLSKKK